MFVIFRIDHLLDYDLFIFSVFFIILLSFRDSFGCNFVIGWPSFLLIWRLEWQVASKLRLVMALMQQNGHPLKEKKGKLTAKVGQGLYLERRFYIEKFITKFDFLKNDVSWVDGLIYCGY